MSDARDQLAALARVGEQLGDAGIDYWLFGGWGVDFHAGAVTRPHDDVDIAIWLDDLARVAELLETGGWSHAPEPDENGGTGYERGGVRLELAYLVRREDGDVYIPRTRLRALAGGSATRANTRASRYPSPRRRTAGARRDEVFATRRRRRRGEGSSRLSPPPAQRLVSRS